MTVFLNGEFVPEEQAVVSVFDRSFCYGDGLFETLLAKNGNLFRWQQHFDRLASGAALLRMALPLSADELHRTALALLGRNGITEGLVRITISRGLGQRGYAPTGKEQPTVVITTHPLPAPATAWKLAVSSFRVAAGDRLLQYKTTSRLVHVLAAMEAREAGADEALTLDANGHVTEGGASNVFWVEGGTVLTTPLSAGVLPGVTRAAVLEICRRTGIPSGVRTIALKELLDADAVFVSLTSRGVLAVSSIDGKELRTSDVVTTLARAYNELVIRETSPDVSR